MTQKQNHSTPIAIVGIGCIFAKSEDQKAFYHLFTRGVDGITDPPDTHHQLLDYFDPDPKKPDHIYCKKGGYIPLTGFDPTEFSIPPNILEATDTSQLLGLVTAKRALEDAGYGENGKPFDRTRTSVILGVTGTQELAIPLGGRLGHPIWRRALKASGISDEQAGDIIKRISNGYVEWQENSFPGLLGNVVAGRIANRLDLGGTNCVVDAACASSMGAVHMALLELRSGRSDMALTGGVDTINDAFMHMCFSKTHILSSTGDIRPFSKAADGTLLGEGIGIMVLKRLADAEKDGNRIYAVIKGLGSASDGRSNSIYAPNAEGQKKALKRAYREANIDPSGLKLLEAHGTGTRVGDQVEFQALCEVFAESSPNGNGCALGSVKSNIGHTKASAGAAGLIKAALSIYHKVLPPTLKAQDPDPTLGIEKSPFYINTKLRPWMASGENKRAAGVSAFGFGGSNFHAVLEEYQENKSEPSWDGAIEIAAFSDHSHSGLYDQLIQWNQTALKDPTRHKTGKLARQSRSRFNRKETHRLVMVLRLDDGDQPLAETCKIAQERLAAKQYGLEGTVFIVNGQSPGGMAFLFPGQGSQYVGMGRDLICCFPESLSVFQDASRTFDHDKSLEEYLYPRLDADPNDLENQLRQTHTAQPAIGAVSTAMFQALARFGAVPNAVCGHSYGELVALHAAGWISQKELWQLSLDRGRLMAAAGQSAGESGQMLAVKAPLDQIEALVQSLGSDVVLANRNSLDQGVLSGTRAGIEEAQAACRKQGWKTVPLPVAAAFHSHLVAKAQAPFAKSVEKVNFTPGPVQVMSNTRGEPYPTEKDEIQQTLAGQLASPVDFLSNIQSLYKMGIRTFVEIGPKTVLSQLVRSSLKGSDFHAMAMDQSGGKKPGVADLAGVLGKLAALGHDVDLNRWEKPMAARRLENMSIPLSGTNYRPATKPAIPAYKTAPAVHPDNQGGPTEVKRPIKAANAVPLAMKSRDNGAVKRQMTITPPFNPPMDSTMKGHSNQSLQNAFSAVQQGLSSMQALQAQTVKAHEKFLDTQAQASTTLQQMIQSIQQLAVATMGQGTVAPCPSEPAHPDTATAFAAPKKSTQTTEPQRIETQPAAKPMPTPSVQAVQDNGAIHHTLVDIVAELTGYPAEMLGLEMDIESDLGIDSIKRVEILSALEEKMPHLPKVTPDMMGTLKTLGQICDHLAGAAQPAAQPAAHGASPVQPAQNNGAIHHTLVDIVAELTGYPAEMLGLEMDIESDLGIDSIKRVEILSALEEKMPHLPKVTPDMMGTLKTLGQICDHLASAAQPAAHGASAVQPAQDNGAIHHTLVDIVAELTGYPAEMLGLEMDIESDLGIDSIKRVEILSALEEKMPHLPKVTPDMMGTLKTLGQICDHLAGAAQPAAHGASPVQPAQDNGAIHHTLVDIVAELTGYPAEMLGLEMDIESDLGIDSIKRVEILSALEEKMPHLPKVTPDMMGTLKTLGQICDHLAFKKDGEAKADLNPDASPKLHLVRSTGKERVERQIVQTVSLETPGENKRKMPARQLVGVIGGKNKLRGNLVRMCNDLGFCCLPFVHPDDLEKDGRPIAGLVLMAPLSPVEAFKWAKACSSALNTSGKSGPAFFLTVSFLDGAFGFNNGPINDPVQGALAGLAKTAAIEWPNVHCRALDIDPAWTDDDAVSRAIVREINTMGSEKRLEVGLARDRRIGLSLIPSQVAEKSPIQLDSKDVVLITGGARGVTAAAAHALATETRCKMALLGRSPAPVPEPEWLHALNDIGQIKKAILTNEFQGRMPLPKTIEDSYKKWMANRQIQTTLKRLTSTGAAVHYFSMDVRNEQSVTETVDHIRRTVGPIRALIHGAGVLKDRLIADKQTAQFEMVYDTKVRGLLNCLAATDKDHLKYIVLFSSVSARLGNQGQADYAMANEVLNKVARQTAHLKPACKVAAINWGPWDGGMVTPSLKRNFVQNGIALIPMELGAKAMVTEMAQAEKGPVEVVIGGPLPSASVHIDDGDQKPDRENQLSLMATLNINVNAYPVLQSHFLDGRPVVPLAIITEWLAHGALHANPGLVLHGIDGLRIFHGITLDNGHKTVRMMAGKARRNGQHYEVTVEIRNGAQESLQTLHSGATVILADQIPAPPVFNENGHFKNSAFSLTIDEIYRDILFHGQDLHGIQEIIRLSPEGISARLSAAPPPADWVTTPLRSRWIADPLVLDSAFQMAIVWCKENLGKVSLPSYAASYRQYSSRFPDDGVSAVLEVQTFDERKMVGNFTFLNSRKEVVARLNGYEAIMDPLLINAFKAA